MEQVEEIWKPVVGHEGYYEVSNKGNIRSLDRINMTKRGYFEKRKSRSMKIMITKLGYHRVTFKKNNVDYTVFVHRVVAMAFIPNPDNKPQVNHKDLCKTNNHADNLEWNTALENIRHCKNLKANCFGENHYKAVVGIEIVKEMRYVYMSQLYSFKELAFIYKMSLFNARKIITGDGWRNVDYPAQQRRKVNKEKLSKELNEKMAKLNITQQELANIICTSRSAIWYASAGRGAGLPLSIMLAAWLNIDYKDLLDE